MPKHARVVYSCECGRVEEASEATPQANALGVAWGYAALMPEHDYGQGDYPGEACGWQLVCPECRARIEAVLETPKGSAMPPPGAE